MAHRDALVSQVVVDMHVSMWWTLAKQPFELVFCLLTWWMHTIWGCMPSQPSKRQFVVYSYVLITHSDAECLSAYICANCEQHACIRAASISSTCGALNLIFSCTVYTMYVGMYLFLKFTKSCDLVLEIVNKPPSLQPSFEDCVPPAAAAWCTPHEPIMHSSAPSKPYRRPWSWLVDYLQVVVLYHLHVFLNGTSWLS